MRSADRNCNCELLMFLWLQVLELKKGNLEAARSGFNQAHTLNPHIFEAPYNSALLCHKLGDSQVCVIEAEHAR